MQKGEHMLPFTLSGTFMFGQDIFGQDIFGQTLSAKIRRRPPR